MFRTPSTGGKSREPEKEPRGAGASLEKPRYYAGVLRSFILHLEPKATPSTNTPPPTPPLSTSDLSPPGLTSDPCEDTLPSNENILKAGGQGSVVWEKPLCMP